MNVGWQKIYRKVQTRPKKIFEMWREVIGRKTSLRKLKLSSKEELKTS
jgi:hypothetical protein